MVHDLDTCSRVMCNRVYRRYILSNDLKHFLGETIMKLNRFSPN